MPATAYTPTTTQPITNYIPKMLFAPANVPVFDHNPVTGEALGLSVWEARTNLLLRSQEFDNAYWTKTNTTISADQIIAPDGTLTADIATTTSTADGILRAVTIVANSTNTVSYLVKNISGAAWVRVVIYDSTSPTNRFTGWFNVSTGAVGSATNGGTGSGSVASIENRGNGFYRLRLSGAVGNSITNAAIQISTATADLSTTGVSGVSYSPWGAQLEAGAFATPYIPTVASTVARSADAPVMTGVNFSRWFNAGAGTLVLDATPNGLSAGAGVSINDATTSNRIRLALTSVSDQATVTTGGTAQAVLDGGTPAAGTAAKFALSYKANDFALSLNGGAVATDTVGTVPVVTQMQIGAETTTVGSVYIRSLAYYPIDLSDANIVAVTA